MMKWRVQGKSGCSTRKTAGIRSAKRATAEESDDVRASLDFLDKVIAEYNGNVAENGVTPEDDAIVAKPRKTQTEELPPPALSDERPDVPPPPPHERFSINLVIVNDVVKENEHDTTPPPVPKRPPPSLPRSSSTGSVTSAREYPVSPPPRRRYLSPERRRRALMMNGNAANGSVTSATIPDSPDNRLDRRFRCPITELQEPFDQKSIIQAATTRPPTEQPPVTAVACQSDTSASRMLLGTVSQHTYVDSVDKAPLHLDRVDCFDRSDSVREHPTSASDFKPYRSPPVQTRLPKEFADLSSPMEVSRALVSTGSRAFDTSTSSSAESRLPDGIATKDDSLRRQAASPICSRAFFYSSKPRVSQRRDESTNDIGDEVTSRTEPRAGSLSVHNIQGSDITEEEIVSQNMPGSLTPAVCANNIPSDSEDGKIVRVVNGRYSPNETTRDRENTRLTVTFRTLPETGSFRRKCESRNSIHVDLNVRDGLPYGRTQSSASSSSSDTGDSVHVAAVPSSGLCRSRSLRSHRKPELPDGVAASRTMEDFSPPPLPPRKTKEEARRQESASPTLKRVTFHILPTTHENPERPSSAEKPPTKDCAEDGFFTRPPPKAPSPVVVKGRAPSPMCQRVTNGSPVAGKIKEPSPQCQRRLNGCSKTAPSKVNGVHGKAGPRDTPRSQGHAKASTVVKKTFEPPSAASDVSTDCYNVYNVRTGKISSTVTKPNALSGSTGRVPLESVQCANGSATTRREGQLTKLRNISPTREAEKLIGKIISRCKSSAVLNGKDRKPASPPPAPPTANEGNGQPQLLKLTARQQQRHSRCTKCALAQAAK